MTTFPSSLRRARIVMLSAALVWSSGSKASAPVTKSHCREDGEFALQRPTPHHDRAINNTTTMMNIHYAASRIGSCQHDSSPDDARDFERPRTGHLAARKRCPCPHHRWRSRRRPSRPRSGALQPRSAGSAPASCRTSARRRNRRGTRRDPAASTPSAPARSPSRAPPLRDGRVHVVALVLAPAEPQSRDHAPSRQDVERRQAVCQRAV